MKNYACKYHKSIDKYLDLEYSNACHRFAAVWGGKSHTPTIGGEVYKFTVRCRSILVYIIRAVFLFSAQLFVRAGRGSSLINQIITVRFLMSWIVMSASWLHQLHHITFGELLRFSLQCSWWSILIRHHCAFRLRLALHPNPTHQRQLNFDLVEVQNISTTRGWNCRAETLRYICRKTYVVSSLFGQAFLLAVEPAVERLIVRRRYEFANSRNELHLALLLHDTYQGMTQCWYIRYQ